jgi:hypothetical protein
MTINKALDAEYVRSRLDCDPVAGTMTWLPKSILEKETRRANKIWNTRYAGKPAGTISHYGYVVIAIGGGIYGLHRLLWLHVHGEWPAKVMDHINGNRTDNRISNLRKVTRSQNNMNSALRKDSTSGIKGVSWHSQANKWRATIQSHKQQKHLGLFATIEDATKAYRAAAAALFGEHGCNGVRS